MFGFLLGTACLVGRVWVLRSEHRRWGSCGGCGRFDHPRGHDRDSSSRGFGGRMFLRFLFERLDTTPGQEKVIRASVEDLLERVHSARREVEASRKDVARALRAESFDAEAMGEAFAKHDAAMSELRGSAMDALAKVHEALDSRQRERLADLVESGLGRRYHGPYRTAI